MEKLPLRLSLISTLAALTLLTLAEDHMRAAMPRDDGRHDPDGISRIRQIEKRVVRLKTHVESERRAMRTGHREDEVPVPDRGPMNNLLRRVDQLLLIARSMEPTHPLGSRDAASHLVLERRILDPGIALEKRIVALDRLRMVHGPDAIHAELRRHARDWFRLVDDETARRQLLDSLVAEGDETGLPLVLDCLASGISPDLRTHAMRVAGRFLHREEVRHALEWAATYDASGWGRRTAADCLNDTHTREDDDS